jgi:hypothetical protein
LCHFLKSADFLLYWYVPLREIWRRLAIMVCAVFWNTGMYLSLKCADVDLRWTKLTLLFPFLRSPCRLCVMPPWSDMYSCS